MARPKPPYGQVFEIDSGEATGAEVGRRHLWLVISGPDVRRDGLVIALPLTGLDQQRTNYDVPFRPDDIGALRDPVGISLKNEGQCYVLTSKPRHFSAQRLPDSPYGVMADAVIRTSLHRLGSALGVNISLY